MASVAASGGNTDDIKDYMHQLGVAARRAAVEIGRAPTGLKNQALLAIAEQIDLHRSRLAEANEADLVAGRANGLDDAMRELSRKQG